MKYTIHNYITRIQRVWKKYFINKKIYVYKTKITHLVYGVIHAEKKQYQHEETIFGNNSKEYIKCLESAFRVRQLQMKEGDIAQKCIGNFYGWEDLGVGHITGLDCRTKDNSIIMDVKNKYNTCNSGSQQHMLDKLANYKKNNPDTLCVWGIINPKPNCNKLTQTIIHNNVEIQKIQGNDLLKLVFTYDNNNYSQEIIHYIKELMYN